MIPEPKTLTAGLDYLCTLAPHRVRAVPAAQGQWRGDQTPMQYQFFHADKWGDSMSRALEALEQECGLHHFVLTIYSSKTATVTVRADNRPLAFTRSAPGVVTAWVLALVAVLQEELNQCAQ